MLARLLEHVTRCMLTRMLKAGTVGAPSDDLGRKAAPVWRRADHTDCHTAEPGADTNSGATRGIGGQNPPTVGEYFEGTPAANF